MTTRTFATFDPAAHSSELELEESGLVIVHNVTANNANRIARATDPQAAGDFYVEAIFYGDDGDIDAAALGVLKSTQALGTYLGASADSIGWRPGLGEVWQGGATIATGLNTAALGQTVGMRINLDDDELTFYLNGTPIETVAIGSGSWYVGASVGGAVAYDLRGFVNFGQRAFDFTFTDQPAGWFEDSEPLATIFAASRSDYISHPIDTPANQPFPKLVDEAGAYYERGVNFLPWGGSAVRRAGVGALRIRNDARTGPLDSYVAGDVRREALRARMVGIDQTLDDGELVMSAIVDRIDSDGPNAVKVALRDSLALLEEPLQRRLFSPATPVEAARNQPVPITLGAVRNMAPVLIDEVNRIYALHDAPVTNLAAVKDKGDPLDPSASIPDFQLSADLRNVVLANLPIGKLTADISSSGELVVLPGAEDVLAGAGIFEDTTWTEDTLLGTNTDEDPDHEIYIDIPAGWELSTSAGTPSGDDAVYAPTLSDYGWITTGGTWIGSGGASDRYTYGGVEGLRIGALNMSSTGLPWMLRTTGNVLEAGKTYRWRIEVAYIGGTDSPFQTAEGGFVLAISEAVTGEDVLLRVNAPGVYSGYFTADADARLYLGTHRYDANNRPKVAILRGLVVEELQEFQEAELQGITFAEFQRQILEVRGQLDAALWSAEDAEAIDEAAPYPFGYFTADETTLLEAASAPLHSLLVSMYPDRDGRIRFARLRAPEAAPDADIVADLTPANLLGDFEVVTDLAPGLTTRFGVRKNWSRYGEADFVDDLVEVTATTRRRYMAEAQITVASAVNLAGPYRLARNQPPFVSLLDDPAHGQAIVDELCDLYGVLRAFYRGLRVRMRPNLVIDPADIIRLTFPRYGLDAGEKLFVVTARDDWDKREIIVSAWGRKL